MRSCKLLLQVALATACMACAHTEPGIRTIEVEVPVPQPCLTQEDLADPKYQEPPSVRDLILLTPESAVADRAVLVSSALRLRAWGKELLAAHVACAE